MNCTTLDIPKNIIDKTRARDANYLMLDIDGTANTFNFTDSIKLTILGRESKNEFIFIQTDRPLYTSGKKGMSNVSMKRTVTVTGYRLKHNLGLSILISSFYGIKAKSQDL